MAGADRPTLRVFACDCAARVAPLYERFGRRAELLERARAEAIAAAAAAAATRAEAQPAAAIAPRRAGALELALARIEDEVDALEEELACEATVTRSATSSLGHFALARSAQRVSRLEDGAADDPPEPPFRMLAVAMAAARAIDEATLVGAGGSLSRINTMCAAEASPRARSTPSSGSSPGKDPTFAGCDRAARLADCRRM
jgi:hypothetical protein